MNAYLTSVIDNVKKKYANQPEFVQTVEEVLNQRGAGHQRPIPSMRSWIS